MSTLKKVNSTTSLNSIKLNTTSSLSVASNSSVRLNVSNLGGSIGDTSRAKSSSNNNNNNDTSRSNGSSTNNGATVATTTTTNRHQPATAFTISFDNDTQRNNRTNYFNLKKNSLLEILDKRKAQDELENNNDNDDNNQNENAKKVAADAKKYSFNLQEAFKKYREFKIVSISIYYSVVVVDSIKIAIE